MANPTVRRLLASFPWLGDGARLRVVNYAIQKEPLMSPITPNINLAARMGRWSASHWKTAVFGWLAFVTASLVVGQMVGTKTLQMNQMSTGQARQADQMLSRAGLQSDPQTEIVLIQSRTHTAGDKAFRAVVTDVAGAVRPFSTI
jgi:RND superfamily putative drug exporter